MLFKIIKKCNVIYCCIMFILQESRACVFGCVFTSWPHKLAIFSLNPDLLACLLLEQKLVEGNPNKDKS